MSRRHVDARTAQNLQRCKVAGTSAKKNEHHTTDEETKQWHMPMNAVSKKNEHHTTDEETKQWQWMM